MQKISQADCSCKSFPSHSWSFSNSFPCHSGELPSVWHKPPSLKQPMKPSLNLQNNMYFLTCSILFCLANTVSITHSCFWMFSFIEQVLVLIIVAEWGPDLHFPEKQRLQLMLTFLNMYMKTKRKNTFPFFSARVLVSVSIMPWTCGVIRPLHSQEGVCRFIHSTAARFPVLAPLNFPELLLGWVLEDQGTLPCTRWIVSEDDLPGRDGSAADKAVQPRVGSWQQSTPLGQEGRRFNSCPWMKKLEEYQEVMKWPLHMLYWVLVCPQQGCEKTNQKIQGKQSTQVVKCLKAYLKLKWEIKEWSY